MKRMIALMLVIVILLSNMINTTSSYADTSDLSDYEKEILNAYIWTIGDISSTNDYPWGRNIVIGLYSYDGTEYDFDNKNEEILSYESSTWKRFIRSSYEKRYDSKKKQYYLVVNGLLCVEDYDNRIDVENVHQVESWVSDIDKDGKPIRRWVDAPDSWGIISLPTRTLYRVTLGVYVKEIDGKLYAYGEKYKYKDISDEDLVTPYDMTEDEYINYATYLHYEYNVSYDGPGRLELLMEDMYGLEDPEIKRYGHLTVEDIRFIPIIKSSSAARRHFPVGVKEDYRFLMTF